MRFEILIYEKIIFKVFAELKNTCIFANSKNRLFSDKNIKK
jgi:hypothetical protein